jgi:hypothetical protein
MMTGHGMRRRPLALFCKNICGVTFRWRHIARWLCSANIAVVRPSAGDASPVGFVLQKLLSCDLPLATHCAVALFCKKFTFRHATRTRSICAGAMQQACSNRFLACILAGDLARERFDLAEKTRLTKPDRAKPSRSALLDTRRLPAGAFGPYSRAQ